MPHRVPPILTPASARMLLEGRTRLSLDLGISEVEVTQTSGGVALGACGIVGYNALERIAEKKDSAYFLSGGSVFQVALAGRRFYKLVPTERAPTLEIDGVRMHRTTGITPDGDAEGKLASLGLDGGVVLDTCTGLGYTAVGAVRRGAEAVVTIELEPDVLRVALMNPWSSQLFNSLTIHKILGDCYVLAGAFPPSLFDYVVHDPPRHRHAGHLYGLDFHRMLYRILKPGGRLYHYTGAPRSRYRGVSLQRGVAERLAQTGFTDLQYHDDTLGLTCTKPTSLNRTAPSIH